MSVKVIFEIGHIASLRSQPTQNGFTHDWELYVRGCDSADISHYIDKVVFNLHESFPKPKRVLKEPPYCVKESGYGGFVLAVDIYYKNRLNRKKITYDYDLTLPITGTVENADRKTQLFNKPPDDFRRKLLKGGGFNVSNVSKEKLFSIKRDKSRSQKDKTAVIDVKQAIPADNSIETTATTPNVKKVEKDPDWKHDHKKNDKNKDKEKASKSSGKEDKKRKRKSKDEAKKPAFPEPPSKQSKKEYNGALALRGDVSANFMSTLENIPPPQRIDSFSRSSPWRIPKITSRSSSLRATPSTLSTSTGPLQLSPNLQKQQPRQQKDYISQLRDIQEKIMSLEDNNELQKIVELIIETGNYEITDDNKNFDFDLCTLDRSTVQRLQLFFPNSCC